MKLDFFSPLGGFSDNIANLSPLAYKEKKNFSKSSLIKSECNETFLKVYLHSKFYSPTFNSI